ncbi:MAG: hypothetical protein ACYDCX_12050 [Acidithiobacillus sp.]
MKSYIYPKLMREEMNPLYAENPDARYAAVNRALVETDLGTLSRMGLRRARQQPKAGYEPFGVALGDAALRVLDSLPASTSRSALIQWILSEKG